MSRMTYAMGLAFALSVGAAAASSAQVAQRPADTQQQARRGGGGRGENMLLNGINLSATQKQQVEAVRAEQRKEMEANRARREQKGGGARTQRDTTGMGARRTEMGKRREQEFAKIRTILTPDQRVQFDRNVADMKARMAQRKR